MESLSLASPHEFHHRRQEKSPHHVHKHLQTVTDNGGYMYGHESKHGHGHGRRGHHIRRVDGEGKNLLSKGGRKGREGKGLKGREGKGLKGRDGCHGHDKGHGGHHARWRSPALHVFKETAGQEEVLTAVNELAGQIEKESLTAVRSADDAAKSAAAAQIDCDNGCHRDHGRHGILGGKDGRVGRHGKHKFGKEHKRDKSHKGDKRYKGHKGDKRNAPLDVIASMDAYTLPMDAPGVHYSCMTSA